MAEETQELPIAEEPTPQAEAEPKQNVDDLIAELEKVNIETPQQLQGKLEAGAQAGRLAQLLGDEKKLRVEAQEEVNRLKAQPQKEQNWDEYPEGRPIDIEAAIERSIDKTLSKRETKARQAQEASIHAYNTITTDKNFHLVEEVWQEKIKNPAYIYQVQSGSANPLTDYQSMVVDYFQDIAKRSLDTITTMQGGGKISAPHVESGESRSPSNIVSEGTGEMPESIKRLEALKAKVATGYVPTEDELVDMVDSVAFAPIV